MIELHLKSCLVTLMAISQWQTITTYTKILKLMASYGFPVTWIFRWEPMQIQFQICGVETTVPSPISMSAP